MPDCAPGDAAAPPADITQPTPDVTEEVSADSEASPCEPCQPSEITAEHWLDPSALTPDLERTAGNPLKGFITSYLWGEPSNDLEDSMEFIYLPMSAVWDETGATFESGLEPLLDAAADREHQVVLRIYIDYPTKENGLPPHILSAIGCTAYPEHGGGCSPNYDHPMLLEAMLGLIEALGLQYDGDPRLGVLQMGLLGFWGEWHTYPHTDYFASLETQNAILHATDQAFEITALQARYPKADTVSLRFGFHDDSFAHSTLGEIGWFFWPSMVAAGADGRWQEVMMGGELRPELQGSIFEDGYETGEYAQDLQTCVDTTHASYLLNYKAFSESGVGYQGDELVKAKEASLKMGYTFEVKGASLTLSGLTESEVKATVEVTVAQTGVAPFYYPVFLTAEVSGGETVATSDDDLRTLLPGEERTVVLELGETPQESVAGGLGLRLMSGAVLASQEIRFGTTSPWTDDSSPLQLQWPLTCDTSSGPLALGAIELVEGQDCPCRCDVDGVARTCSGATCSAPQE